MVEEIQFYKLIKLYAINFCVIEIK